MIPASYHPAAALLSPDLGFKLIIWGGGLLALLGALKLVIWAFGEFAPHVYARVQSDNIRDLLTGRMNRLVFGLGGLITVLLGLIFVGLGIFFERLIVH